MCEAVCAYRPVIVDCVEKEVKRDKNKDPIFQGAFLGDLWQRIFSFADCVEIAGTNKFFREQYVKRVRLILQSFFSKEKIVSLLPLFTSIFIPKAATQLSDHETLCMYYHMRIVHRRLLQFESESQGLPDLVQDVYWRSLGILSQGEIESKNPKERGVFLESMIAAGISVASREVVTLKGKERIMCLPKEISALSPKVLDVHSQCICNVVLEKMTVLTHLNLSENKLTEISLQEKDVPALQMIDISYNPIKIFPEQLFSFKNHIVITIDQDQQKKFSVVLQKYKIERKNIVIELR